LFNRYTSKQTYMTVPPSLGTPEEARRTVETAEADFEARLVALSAAVSRECAEDGIRILRLTGPTCSGKTTFSKKLTDGFAAFGRNVHTVSIDNFYRPREFLIERSKQLGLDKVDYDSIDTIDFDALSECVREIFTDDETLIPVFDFNAGKAVGFEHISYESGEMFIFEGIQAIYPEVTGLFSHYNYVSVFICAIEPLICNGKLFEPNEIRLLRRLVRDYKFRGSSPERTFEMWDGVRENEDINIFPYVGECNIKINSTLPYEINVLAPHLRKILSLVEPGSRYYGSARDILSKIEERKQAKLAKDYAKSDAIRDELKQKGVTLIDTKEGTTYKLD